MNTEEYLRRRIDDLERAVCDEALPMKQRKNQAFALLNYRNELIRELARGKHDKQA